LNFGPWQLGQCLGIRRGHWTGSSEGRNPFQPAGQLAVFLLEGVDPRFRRRELCLELSVPARILFRFLGTLRFRCRKRGDDRGEIDLRERARGCQPLAPLWRARAVEGTDRRKINAIENAVAGRP
jgi:hypothetical protein